MSTISKIICKKCNKDLTKNLGIGGCDEGYAAELMNVHDKVTHTQDYQITFRGNCLAGGKSYD